MAEKPRPPRRIAIIDGHPDPDRHHLVHALADACASGARAAGHFVRRIDIAEMNFPILHSAKAWREAAVSADIRHCQDAILWADHLILLYPLWLGDVPALLKAFLEQVLRPGFAIREGASPHEAALLRGRSARIIVTMGMPAPVYRLYFGAHSLRSLERNILGYVGIHPIRRTLIGSVGDSEGQAETWLKRAAALGARGS